MRVRAPAIISRHVEDGHGAGPETTAATAGARLHRRSITGRAGDILLPKGAGEDEDVEPALFSYPGPKPQSRETAIVMLADSAEAAVRSSSEPLAGGNRRARRRGHRRADWRRASSTTPTSRCANSNVISESFKATLRGRLPSATGIPAAGEPKRSQGASPTTSRRRRRSRRWRFLRRRRRRARGETKSRRRPENRR